MKIERLFARLVILTLAVSFSVTLPRELRGQTPIEVTAGGGLFLPTGDVFRSVIRVSPDFQAEEFVLVSKTGHEAALSIGARLTSWLSPRLAVEAAVFFSESRVTITQEIEDFYPPPPRNGSQASVLAATARGRLRIGPTDSPISFTVAGGGGLLSRGGDAYDFLEGTTDFTVVLGTGLSVRVAPNVALRVDLEDYMSWPTVQLPTFVRQDPVPGTTEFQDGRFQNDFVISQGITIFFGGRN